MTITSKISAILFVLAFASVVQAKDDGTHFSRFRVRLNDSTSFKGRAGVLSGDSLSGVRDNQGHFALRLNDIKSIDNRIGNRALTGAAIGGSIGAVYALASIIAVDADRSKVINSNAITPVLLTSTGIGFALGAGVGILFGNWKRVDLFGSDFGILAVGQRIEFCLKF